MKLSRAISLEDIYEAVDGPTFMTGIQALVRLPLMQRRLDRKHGLRTAGLVSGYRGSPLGAYDQQLWKAEKFLSAHDVLFQPGLNEDLAATALWGAQTHRAFGSSHVDGVFGIWYGKGNGVDRTGDVFRNANALGTSRLGGVLAVAGDDHSAQSSMFPHHTDGIFKSVSIPVLQPANVSEILSLGLIGIALSRFSGLWVAMKTVAEVVESAAAFDLPDAYPTFLSPSDLVPSHGLNWDPSITWPADRAEYERRLIDERLPAAIGWAVANRIDRPIIEAEAKRLVIVTVGKAHQDLMEALSSLGIGGQEAQALGLSVYKVAMSWPLAVEPLLAFARDAHEIFVVEEKTALVEDQIKAALFNNEGRRTKVTGKTDVDGSQLLPIVSEFSSSLVARALRRRIQASADSDLQARFEALEAVPDTVIAFPARKPFFCSGCPHNSSTKTPEGSVAAAGIGCHIMAISQPSRRTATFTQMGGEGAQWIGAAPFSNAKHIFQNMGDGTYQHSGLLAVRAAVAARTNITFKILYNDAVAMTGGQPAEGAIEPTRVLAQLVAEGVGQVHLVTDDPARWSSTALPRDVAIHHRDGLDTLQKQLRDVPGVTAIVYEQTCAAEKRRRRKKGAFPDPDKRIFINERVCEGCGDCSVQSNCISVEPLPTDFGTKRKINQSACNKDFSCVKGFCPSFIEIEGGKIRKPDASRIKALEADLLTNLPQPDACSLERVYNVYVAGIGGLGVLTTGALLGTAAHLSGFKATVLDFTGLAQKNGAVVSQVRIAPADEDIHAVRIGAGEVDLLLGTDALVAASSDAQHKLKAGRSAIVLNSDETPTADVVDDRDFTLPSDKVIETLLTRAGNKGFLFAATRIAEGLFGNNVAANTMIVGYAWQQGLLPLSAEAFEAAIEANGAAIELNKRAFAWGRLAAVDLPLVEEVAGIAHRSAPVPEPIEAFVARRVGDLAAYQDLAYSRRYTDLIERARAAASPLGERGQEFVRAIAAQAYRLMAYKDEYEVARLYSAPEFRTALEAQFSDRGRMRVYLAPPLLSGTDLATGRPKKRLFGPWIFTAFRVLAKLKGLRGTRWDPFGYTEERRAERSLRDEYFATVDNLCKQLNQDTVAKAATLAALPDMIRGYGPVKAKAIADYRARRSAILKMLSEPLMEKAA